MTKHEGSTRAERRSYEASVVEAGKLALAADVADIEAQLRRKREDTAERHRAADIEHAAELAADNPLAADFLGDLATAAHAQRMERLARWTQRAAN